MRARLVRSEQYSAKPGCRGGATVCDERRLCSDEIKDQTKLFAADLPSVSILCIVECLDIINAPSNTQ